MSLDATQMKELKRVNTQTRDTVFGYIRQTAMKIFGDSKFSNAYSCIQFICLMYYWKKDEWDPLQIGSGLSNKNNIITKMEGDIGSWTTHYKSAFLTNICVTGCYQWKFKIHKMSKIWCLIGVWRIQKNVSPPINTFFTCGRDVAYALVLEAGKLVSLKGGGSFEHEDSQDSYCDECKADDIVEMFLDLDKLEISYAVNGQHFGKAFKVKNAKYRAAICLQGEDSAIEFLN